METGRRPLRRLFVFALAAATLAGILAAGAAGAPAGPGDQLLFRIAGGGQLLASSRTFDRAQVSPLIDTIEALPHGEEISKLGLVVATPGEVGSICGEETMACYDPREDRMVIDGQDEELDGVSRASLIAHEYGHHIANNRQGGIWSAFEAGTLRWSTYEQVCELTRAGELFPGSEGARYWENPGEAFAQSYATLVEPQTSWTSYTPLLAPDETALRKIREDVLDPVEPRKLDWQIGGARSVGGAAIGEAMAVGQGSFAKTFAMPYDGRVTVQLRADEGGRYRLSLWDPASGELLSDSPVDPSGEARLHYADCGHRSLEARAEAVGGPASAFTGEILLP
jgi:hypothetical protein